MSKLRRPISTFLVLFPILVQAQFDYTTNNNTVTLWGYTGTNSVVTVPESIDSLPVVKIGWYTFENTLVTKVIIPNTVTNVDQGAFQDCRYLTNVVFGTNVAIIGSRAFWRCTNLTTINIPSKVRVILSETFYSCNKLKNIIIPNTITNIEYNAFIYCGGLSSIVIPQGISKIDDGTFNSCTNLNNVSIPNSVTRIGIGAFAGCIRLSSISLPNSLTYVEQSAFSSCTNLGQIVIPDNVTTIGNSAFSFCEKLTNVTIGSNVRSIGDSAFAYCYRLPNITFPSAVTNIGHKVFNDCFFLTSINVSPDNSYYSSVDGVLFNKAQTTLIEFPFGRAGNYTVPNGTLNIHTEAFSGCNKLKGVTFPDGLENIGYGAFENCNGLTNVTIPASVTGFGIYAFSECWNLKGFYVMGNARPAHSSVLDGTTTVYYFPGTTGWGSNFGGRPTTLWNPQVPVDSNFGIRTNKFGFTVAATNNLTVLVEASTNLQNTVWFPVRTNTIAGGSFYFSDSQWTNHPMRIYRLNWPRN